MAKARYNANRAAKKKSMKGSEWKWYRERSGIEPILTYLKIRFCVLYITTFSVMNAQGGTTDVFHG